jgi:hypothetical protein
MEMVVLIVVEAPFGTMELVIRTVDPLVCVIVVALGVDVYSVVRVVVP